MSTQCSTAATQPPRVPSPATQLPMALAGAAVYTAPGRPQHWQERCRSISKEMPVTRGRGRLGCRQELGACRVSLSPATIPRLHTRSSWAQGHCSPCLHPSQSCAHVGQVRGGRERTATTAPSPPRALPATSVAASELGCQQQTQAEQARQGQSAPLPGAGCELLSGPASPKPPPRHRGAGMERGTDLGQPPQKPDLLPCPHAAPAAVPQPWPTVAGQVPHPAWP